MGVFLAALSAFVFAINNVVVKKGQAESKHSGDTGLFITVFMNVIILGIVFFVAVLVREGAFHFSWTALLFFMIAGLCTTGLGRMTLFSSISYIGPSKASAIRNTTPIFTTIFALIFLNETITLFPGTGMILLLSGILYEGYRFFQSGNDLLFDQTQQKQQLVGYGLALLSAMIFGIGQGVRKQGLLELNDAFFGAWIGAVTSFIFLILYQSLRKGWRTNIVRSFTSLNPYYLLAGILTSIGPLLFFLAAQSIQISYVSVVAATEPLMTIIISTIFLKRQERITIHTWITIAMILLGTILMVMFIPK